MARTLDRCDRCRRPAEGFTEERRYNPVRKKSELVRVGWCDQHNPAGFRIDWSTWPAAAYAAYVELAADGCRFAVGLHGGGYAGGYLCRGALVAGPCEHLRAAIPHVDRFLPPIEVLARSSTGAAAAELHSA